MGLPFPKQLAVSGSTGMGPLTTQLEYTQTLRSSPGKSEAGPQTLKAERTKARQVGGRLNKQGTYIGGLAWASPGGVSTLPADLHVHAETLTGSVVRSVQEVPTPLLSFQLRPCKWDCGKGRQKAEVQGWGGTEEPPIAWGQRKGQSKVASSIKPSLDTAGLPVAPPIPLTPLLPTTGSEISKALHQHQDGLWLVRQQ